MQIPLVQVDAFTDRPIAGNPAAVMVLPRWLPDPVLQGIAAENNLSETAFLVEEPEGWHLRWFTPTVEVDLCGHATLASGYVLLRRGGDAVRFRTRSGELEVRREGELLALSLPALPPHPVDRVPAEVVAALGAAPVEVLGIRAVHHAAYWLARFERQADVAALAPDFRRLRAACANVACTAPADDDGVDFVSRFFAPGSGVDEDPVTGSAHASLAPYWADRLQGSPTRPLRARQISARGGEVTCRLDGDRVWIAGRCAPYLEGTVTLPDDAEDQPASSRVANQ